MTKVIMNIDRHGNIMFDCLSHSDDHDVCTIISTLCNVLVEACLGAGYEPTMYAKGHVRIDMNKAPYPTTEVFRTVGRVMHQVAEQNPEHIRIY